MGVSTTQITKALSKEIVIMGCRYAGHVRARYVAPLIFIKELVINDLLFLEEDSLNLSQAAIDTEQHCANPNPKQIQRTRKILRPLFGK